VLLTLYDENENFCFSNRSGLIYVRGLGNIDTEKFSIDMNEVELGSRKFKIRKAALEDVSGSLERGPQIILPKDVSFIGFKMNLPFREKLLEIGGGNGGFSIMASLMFRVRIESYEINKDSFELLKRNINRFEVEGLVKAVNEDGMKAPIEEYEDVFIDSPEPHIFLEGKMANVRNVGSILPTYSQAEAFSRFMKENGFLVNIHEIVDIPIKMSESGLRPESSFLYHTGFIVTANKW
jgi:tRNA A58 N-methylase Trm61